MAQSTVLNEFFNIISFKTDQASLAQAQSAITSFKSLATKVLGTLGAGLSLSWVKNITEEFSGINDAIRGATEGLGEQSEIQKKILDSAQECRESYGKMAGYVDDLVVKNKTLFPIDDAVKFTSLVEKLEKGSGKSNNIGTTMGLLSKAMSAGNVDKNTFSQLYEKAPEVAELIEKSAGKSKTQLEAMAKAGTLSAATVKKAILDAEDDIQRKFGEVDLSITDAITHIRNSWGFWLEDIDSTNKITDKLSRLIIDFSDKLLSGAKKVKSWMDDIANKLGGYDKLLKLVAMSAAALFIALNADKITGFLSGILKLLGGINRETILAAAKWLALFLIIEDIWTFLQGGDSVIGRLLKDAGVDVDYLRETILNFFQDIRDFGENAISKISAFWNDHKEQAQAVFDFLWTGFSDLLHDFLLLVTHISDLISGIITGFQTGDWTQFLNALKQLGLDFVDSLIGIFENLKSLATIIFKKLPQPLQDAFQSVWDWLNGFFGWFGEKIQWIKGLWGDVKSFFLGTGSSTDEDDFGGSSGGTVNEKSDASENNEKPDNKSNFSEEKTGRKSDNSGKTEKSEEKSSSHRSEKSGDRLDPQKQEKNKDKSGNKSDSQNHERAKDKSGSYRLGKTAKSKAVSSNTDRAGSSSSNNKNVPYLNRQNGVALMKNQAWTGGTGVTVKTIKSSPVNNNTKNVSVRQENNQKYTFHVDSTTAADKLRSEVSTQSTQSADGLARMINYGR